MILPWEYPSSVQEVIDDSLKFRKGVIPALQRFQQEGTTNKEPRRRFLAMQKLIDELCSVYDIPPVRLEAEHITGCPSDFSHYDESKNVIVLEGKLSLITLLHEFAHALGKDEYGAVRWSINLFRRVYTIQFDRLVEEGYMLRHKEGR